MKYEIHYTVNEHEDSFVLSGDSIEEIRQQAATELEKRGVDISAARSVPMD